MIAFAPLLLGLAQAGTFRPSVTVEDALRGLEMCRAVITPTGYDVAPIKKAHWEVVRIGVAPGEKDDGSLAAMQAWQVPGSFAMILLSQKDGGWRCNTAAPVRDQATGAKLFSKLPVHIEPTAETGVFEALDNGQKIRVSLGTEAQYPTINLTVSRPTESK